MAQLRISTWGIRNPVPVAILFVALIVIGIASYLSLPIKQLPEVTLPQVSITVTENGAAPSEIETQITRPVENAMAGLPGVQSIQSTVTRGVSTTQIEFPINEDMQKMTDEVRTRMDQTRVNLPRDIDPPTVQRLDIDSQPIITYAVAADRMSDVDLSWFIDDTISRALQGEEGVAQIKRVGGVDREINVIVDPDKLAGFGLTAPQINDALRGFAADETGGQAEIGGRRQTLRVLGTPETVARLREMQIPIAGGRFVRLADVAEVGDGSSEVQAFARLDDQPVVGFQVMKTRDSSEISVEDNVDRALQNLTRSHPGVKFTKIFSTVANTRDNFKATLDTLLEGMLLAAVVVFLFLRDWRATLITAIAMPVSLLPTFGAMILFGFSLNMITLLALTLVIGILVDDAIVEIENIQKRVNAGASPYQAALEGADAIGLAVVATTFTIVVVFLPVSMMPGIPGQFFKEFGLTVSVAVLFSLLTARLLTPLLAAYFLKPTAEPHERGPLQGPYRTALDWALSHRWISVFAGAVLFAASMALIVVLPKGVQPEGNPDYYNVSLQGPPGATPAEMEGLVRDVTALLSRRPETEHVFATVGTASGNGFFTGGGSSVNQGTVTIVLKPASGRPSVVKIQDLVRPLLTKVPDARLTFEQSNFGGGGVTVTLTGENGPELEKTGLELQQRPGLLAVSARFPVIDFGHEKSIVVVEIQMQPALFAKIDDALGQAGRKRLMIERRRIGREIDLGAVERDDGRRKRQFFRDRQHRRQHAARGQRDNDAVIVQARQDASGSGGKFALGVEQGIVEIEDEMSERGHRFAPSVRGERSSKISLIPFSKRGQMTERSLRSSCSSMQITGIL